MRIALADSSELSRKGLAGLLSAAGMDITIEARSGDELVAFISRDLPDAVIMDLRMMPTFTDEGIRCGLQLRNSYPRLPIVYLADTLSISLLSQLSHDLRGIGYVSKRRVGGIDELVSILRDAIEGRSVIDPEIIRLSMVSTSRKLDRLTDRERQVLRSMAEGKSNAALAEEMSLSLKTIEARAAHIYRELGIPATPGINQRVLSVLAYLDAVSDRSI